MNSKEILVEELKCPICLEIPEDKIFLCQNGHPICDTCSANLKICPTCRASFEKVKVRNRTLETLLNSFKFDCTFKDLGCVEKLDRKDLKAHILNCPLSGNHIKLCKEIGFKACEHTTNLQDICASYEHYRKQHDFTIRDDLHFNAHLTSFGESAATPLDSMWTPILINHVPRSPNSKQPVSKILLLSILHGNDNTVSWMCVRLSNEPDGQKYFVYFDIKSLTPEAADLSWRISSTDVGQVAKLLQNAPFRIPIELLLQHYTNKDGILFLTVKLVPMKGKNVSVLHPEPSRLKFISHDCQTVSGAAANVEASQETRHNANCEDCGLSPIIGVRYLKLQGRSYSVCRDCVKNESYAANGILFAVTRNAVEDDKIVIDQWLDVVATSFIYYCAITNPDDVGNENFASELAASCMTLTNLPEKCSTADCPLPPVSMCLQCERKGMLEYYCEGCMETRCPNHVWVMTTWKNEAV